MPAFGIEKQPEFRRDRHWKPAVAAIWKMAIRCVSPRLVSRWRNAIGFHRWDLVERLCEPGGVVRSIGANDHLIFKTISLEICTRPEICIWPMTGLSSRPTAVGSQLAKRLDRFAAARSTRRALFAFSFDDNPSMLHRITPCWRSKERRASTRRRLTPKSLCPRRAAERTAIRFCAGRKCSSRSSTNPKNALLHSACR